MENQNTENKNMENKTDKTDKIINLLMSIEHRVENIENRLEIIENDMKNVNKDCNRMNKHIQFVENTYTLARAPLNFIKNKIENIMSCNTKSELPKLEYEYKE